MIDLSLPYQRVLMVQEAGASYSRALLPEDFRLEGFRPGREEDWARIQLSAGLAESMPEGLRMFEEAFRQGLPEKAENIVFAVASEGRAVGTAALWQGGALGPQRSRVHWVAVEEAYQRRGIAKALMTRVLDLYWQEGGKEPLYLSTQPASYPAVRLYQQFGFRPYWGPEPEGWQPKGSFEAQAREGWALIDEKLREI